MVQTALKTFVTVMPTTGTVMVICTTLVLRKQQMRLKLRLRPLHPPLLVLNLLDVLTQLAVPLLAKVRVIYSSLCTHKVDVLIVSCVATASSAASAGPTTTASEASSSEATSHATSSHSGTTSAHTGSSSQSATTESSKSPSATHTGATTSETPKATSNTSPTATEHSSAATEPTAEPTSNTVVATVPPTVSASAGAASGTTLVVGGSASISSGLGATGVSINPSVVTPTLPSGHFDPAPSSSGAEVVKPLVNFGAMAWVVIAGIAGGALVL